MTTPPLTHNTAHKTSILLISLVLMVLWGCSSSSTNKDGDCFGCSGPTLRDYFPEDKQTDHDSDQVMGLEYDTEQLAVDFDSFADFARFQAWRETQSSDLSPEQQYRAWQNYRNQLDPSPATP